MEKHNAPSSLKIYLSAYDQIGKLSSTIPS